MYICRDDDNTKWVSERDWLVTLLLAIFCGSLGLHRFYCGKMFTGVFFLLTLGFLGIGVIVDLIFIVCRRFKDKEGKFVVKCSILNGKC